VHRTGGTRWLFSVAFYLPAFSLSKLEEKNSTHTFLVLQNLHALLWLVLRFSALGWGGIAPLVQRKAQHREAGTCSWPPIQDDYATFEKSTC